MKYHNPENVPEDKIPEGWRLLREDELYPVRTANSAWRIWLNSEDKFSPPGDICWSEFDTGWTYIVPIKPEQPAPESPTPSRYQWQFRGASFDFYRLCEILGVTHHAQAHALKKVIRAGRSVKPLTQDIDEAIAALSRWKEMLVEDQAGSKP